MSLRHRVRVQLGRGTSNIALAEEVHSHFKCPSCGAAQRWQQTGRSQSRENSVIGFFACTQCNEQIVAKLPLIPGTALPDKAQALREYRTLNELVLRFPQSDEYGTLVPLGHLDESGLVITRRFNGHSLKWHGVARSKASTQLPYAAGRWLRKLHDACPRGYTDLDPDTERKIGYLEQTYASALRRERSVSTVYAHLVGQADVIRTTPLRASWSHGDYKPENVLYDGRKCVGIDTQLEHYSVFAYDLASFLNHLLMAGPAGRHRQHIYADVKKQVIAGYGDISLSDHRAILWAQLYFMLCYWGRYQMRGRLSSLYNHWQVLPLLKMLSSQL